MKEEFYFYTPNSAELKEIEKELKKSKIGSLIFTLIWNGFIGFVIFSAPEVMSFSEGPGWIMLIFVAAGIFLFVNTIKLFMLNTNNLSYSRGKIIDAWKEVHRDSDGDKHTHYYITIEQPNGNINEKVKTTCKMYRNEGAEVVMAYDKKNKIRLVVLKNNDFANEYTM